MGITRHGLRRQRRALYYFSLHRKLSLLWWGWVLTRPRPVSWEVWAEVSRRRTLQWVSCHILFSFSLSFFVFRFVITFNWHEVSAIAFSTQVSVLVWRRPKLRGTSRPQLESSLLRRGPCLRTFTAGKGLLVSTRGLMRSLSVNVLIGDLGEFRVSLLSLSSLFFFFQER